MKKISLIIILLLIISLGGIKAQAPGINGKNFTFGIKTSMHSYYFEHRGYWRYDLDLASQKNFSRTIGLDLEYSISPKISIHASYLISKMALADYHMDKSYNNKTTFDNYTLQTYLSSMFFGVRFYKGFSHFGKYHSISINRNLLQGFTTAESILRTSLPYNEFEYTLVDHPPIDPASFVNWGITLGKGRQIVLSKLLKLDYGFEFNLYKKGELMLSDNALWNHRENLDRITVVIMSDKLKYQTMFNFYLSFGICP